MALFHIANAISKEFVRVDSGLGEEFSKRFYFIICIRYWQDMYSNYPIFDDIIRAFLNMAIKAAVLTGAEASAIVREVRARRSYNDFDNIRAKEDPASTSLIADYDLAPVDRHEAQVGNLARKFEDIAMFDEFTHVIHE